MASALDNYLHVGNQAFLDEDYPKAIEVQQFDRLHNLKSLLPPGSSVAP